MAHVSTLSSKARLSPEKMSTPAGTRTFILLSGGYNYSSRLKYIKVVHYNIWVYWALGNISPIMENHMESNMENEMETGVVGLGLRS